MMQFIGSIMMVLFFSACNNTAIVNATNLDSVVKKTADSAVRVTNVPSGVYQDISFAKSNIDSLISGVYEFYDNWDPSHKEYLNINVFYFFGKVANDSLAEIRGGWPGSEQKLIGRIVFFDENGKQSIKVKLNREPLGYNDVSFRNGVVVQLDSVKDWIQVRIIKSDKAKLYNTNDFTTVRKGYLVKEDIVKVLKKEGNGWDKIEYSNKSSNSKPLVYWIREDDLYDIDPLKWE